MQRLFLSALALLLPIVLSSAAAGKAIAPSPIALRVAQSEVVVVGKVTAIENKTVKAERWTGDTEKADFQVAVVKIEDPILGAKGLTHVKVGFIPVGTGGGSGRFPRRGLYQNLEKDKEYCLFLTPQAGASFYRARNYFDIVLKQGNEFEKQVADAKKYAKLLADPNAGLKAKDAEDRLVTAAMLVGRYRTPVTGAEKPEAIAAEESKLILEALAGADWGERPGREYFLSPLNTFQRLGLTPADGWTPPQDYQQIPAAARVWLKDHSGKYRVKRLVTEKK